MTESTRRHLFISYAWEDAPLAEWLALKLTSEGYLVWCDRFKLLGGESYPKDIDDAIKNQVFRLIALLSHNSISKPNPLKERTLAINIARERQIDFLIPLNVDGLKPTELDWMTSDLTFIPFEDWAGGLKGLLKKLESIKTPRPMENGGVIASETFLHSEIITNNQEYIYTNLLNFIKIPEAIKRFELNMDLQKGEEDFLLKIWPLHKIDPRTVLSFHSPPILPRNLKAKNKGETVWNLTREIDGIRTIDAASSLLRKSIISHCLRKGMVKSKDRKHLYFPNGLLEKNKIKYFGYKGRKTSISVIGERKDTITGKHRYYLCPDFNILRNMGEDLLLRLGIHLHFTWGNGEPMESRFALSRRKKICKFWYNHQWLSRLLAVACFLSDGKENITIGDLENEQIIISSQLIKLIAPFGIDESLISTSPSCGQFLGLPDSDESSLEMEESD